MWQADNSVKIDEICPLEIPNQIPTMSMHIPRLVEKIVGFYSNYHLETTDRSTPA